MTSQEDQNRLGDALGARSLAVAESCTGGAVIQLLVGVAGSGRWLRGGVVAYDPEVKFSLLGVPRGPVVSAGAAVAMARGVARVLDADVGLATTGVAGPETTEGQPVGTVFIAVAQRDDVRTTQLALDGPPGTVRAEAATRAIGTLLDTLDRARQTAP